VPAGKYALNFNVAWQEPQAPAAMELRVEQGVPHPFKIVVALLLIGRRSAGDGAVSTGVGVRRWQDSNVRDGGRMFARIYLLLGGLVLVGYKRGRLRGLGIRQPRPAGGSAAARRRRPLLGRPMVLVYSTSSSGGRGSGVGGFGGK